MLYNLKKKISAWIKANLKTFKIIKKPRIWIDYIMSLQKSNLSKILMDQSVEPNFFKKYAHTLPILQLFFFLKKISQKIQ